MAAQFLAQYLMQQGNPKLGAENPQSSTTSKHLFFEKMFKKVLPWCKKKTTKFEFYGRYVLNMQAHGSSHI